MPFVTSIHVMSAERGEDCGKAIVRLKGPGQQDDRVSVISLPVARGKIFLAHELWHWLVGEALAEGGVPKAERAGADRYSSHALAKRLAT